MPSLGFPRKHPLIESILAECYTMSGVDLTVDEAPKRDLIPSGGPPIAAQDAGLELLNRLMRDTLLCDPAELQVKPHNYRTFESPVVKIIRGDRGNTAARYPTSAVTTVIRVTKRAPGSQPLKKGSNGISRKKKKLESFGKTRAVGRSHKTAKGRKPKNKLGLSRKLMKRVDPDDQETLDFCSLFDKLMASVG